MIIFLLFWIDAEPLYLTPTPSFVDVNTISCPMVGRKRPKSLRINLNINSARTPKSPNPASGWETTCQRNVTSPGPLGGFGKATRSDFGNLSFCVGANHSGKISSWFREIANRVAIDVTSPLILRRYLNNSFNSIGDLLANRVWPTSDEHFKLIQNLVEFR